MSIDRALPFQGFQHDFDFEFGAVRFALLLLHCCSFGQRFYTLIGCPVFGEYHNLIGRTAAGFLVLAFFYYGWRRKLYQEILAEPSVGAALEIVDEWFRRSKRLMNNSAPAIASIGVALSAAFVYVVDVIAFPIVLLLLAITVYAGLLHILLISLVIVLSIIAILVTKPQMQSLVLILSIANGLILFSIAPPLFQVSPMGFGEAVSETGTPNGNLKEVGNPEFGGLVASTPDSRKARHSEKNDKNRNKNDSLQSPTEPEEVKTPKTQPIIDSPHETAPLTLNSEKDKGRNDYIDLPALSIAGIKYSYYALLFAIFLIWIVARVVVTEILNAKREVKYDIDNLNANKGIVLLLSRGELQALTIIRGRWADFLESLRKKNGFAANIASNFVPVEVAGREIVFGCKSIDDFNKTRGVVASAYNPIIQKELRAFFGLPRSIIRFVLVDAEKYDAALNQLRQKGGELN